METLNLKCELWKKHKTVTQSHYDSEAHVCTTEWYEVKKRITGKHRMRMTKEHTDLLRQE